MKDTNKKPLFVELKPEESALIKGGQEGGSGGHRQRHGGGGA